jgi:hypothetical protein
MKRLRGRVITRKQWRHLKRQLKLRGVNPDWWWAPYEVAFWGLQPFPANLIIPIIYKRPAVAEK